MTAQRPSEAQFVAIKFVTFDKPVGKINVSLKSKFHVHLYEFEALSSADDPGHFKSVYAY